MQNDCNLVLYYGSTFTNNQSIWSTNTSMQGNHFCTFQVDTHGFLSIYNGSTSSGLSQCYSQTADQTCVPWSGTTYATGSGHPFFIMLTENGTLDVYDFDNDYPTPVFQIFTNGSGNNYTGIPDSNATTIGQIWSTPPNGSPTALSSLSVYGPYWDFLTKGQTVNVPYMPRGYYLSEGSLSNDKYILTIEDNCTLQIRETSGAIIGCLPHMVIHTVYLHCSKMAPFNSKPMIPMNLFPIYTRPLEILMLIGFCIWIKLDFCISETLIHQLSYGAL